MAVMAAGVTVSRGAGKVQPALLLHGKGVHIRAEQNGFSPFPHGAGDASPHFLRLISVFFQLLRHVSSRLRQVKGDLRPLVKGSPIGNNFFFQIF